MLLQCNWLSTTGLNWLLNSNHWHVRRFNCVERHCVLNSHDTCKRHGQHCALLWVLHGEMENPKAFDPKMEAQKALTARLSTDKSKFTLRPYSKCRTFHGPTTLDGFACWLGYDRPRRNWVSDSFSFAEFGDFDVAANGQHDDWISWSRNFPCNRMGCRYVHDCWTTWSRHCGEADESMSSRSQKFILIGRFGWTAEKCQVRRTTFLIHIVCIHFNDSGGPTRSVERMPRPNRLPPIRHPPTKCSMLATSLLENM